MLHRLSQYTFLLAMMLLTSQAVFAADPGNEAANKDSCTGTCSTCPGKASALTVLADSAKVLLAVKGLDSADEAKRIRSGLGELSGIESCVAFAEQGWVWVAYDNAVASIAQISRALSELGFSVSGEVQRIAPLPALNKGLERSAIYVLLPQDNAKRDAALGKAAALPGVAQLSYDRAYNLLLCDLDPVKTSAQKIKQALVKAGFAAGLPGEEMTQPK